MKILILVQDVSLGGALRQTSLLTAGLVSKGHEVAVVGWRRDGDDWKFVWRAPVEPEILFSDPAGSPLNMIARLIATSATLRKRLKKEKFDVLYAIQGDIVRLAAWLATRGMDTGIVWGIRGSATGIASRRHWKEAVLRRLRSWTSATIPLVIANSTAAFCADGGLRIRHGRQLVIHNGFDAERFKPDTEARRRMRSAWGIAEEKLIGVAARLTASKGHGVFFQAIARLSVRHPDARIVVVGDGPDRRRLERLGRELGVADKTIWAGAQEDMNAVYNALDILCSPSLKGEGCPNVIGEAMACGVLCVVTDVGDSAKLVGELGWIVPPGDVPALADALAAALDGLGSVDRSRLREHITQRFSIEAMVNETEKALYRAAHRRIDTTDSVAIPSDNA